ncbi:putative sulfate exporter family transporter (plasmid) [Rhizorhabdus wittichii]|uniref:Sulfate exporter family transporter n=1 Tax=Rhizorhabdus wittichii TaxID=160791 RepID=A0A975D8T2_9SPHN|nr:putative sulfate exporter family transporter [Rhizorhabdus wittichii]QTH24819.1 putative sulfate exporter family transporter [Rhizorhabdus wittichii]
MKAALPIRHSAPGLVLCAAVAAAALLLERAEILATGKPWLEALVIAIVLGSLVRTLWTPPHTFLPGIDFAARPVLELAVAIMGATVSFGAIAVAGLPLIGSIVGTVIAAIAMSFLIGRLLGLPGKMALLVACGNAICGNSAIAAVAPVIDADSDDVATSIAFTAVLGIGVVIAVPVIAATLHLSAAAGGVLAGLTVYAVPQVIAAAGPMGSAAVQIGTLVKLVRVLMLGPVVTGLSLFLARRRAGATHRQRRHSILTFVPPFIMAFLALAAVNSVGLFPRALADPVHHLSGYLTILAMAGLGLGVDLRSVSAAGPRVVFVVTASLIALGGMAFVTLRLIGLA